MDTLFDQLTKIHDAVYNHFEYKEDIEQYKVDEKWVMPADAWQGTTKIVGDCEDFALACRKLCREQNIQTRLVICTVEGEGHCVLEVNGWILDNRFDKVLSRDYLEKNEKYVWVYISGYNPGDPWVKIIG